MIWLVAIAGFSISLTIPVINTIFNTMMIKAVPPEKFGRFMAITMAISMAFTPVGYLLSGTLADLIGIRNLFLTCASLGLLTAFLTIRSKNVKNFFAKDEKDDTKENRITNERSTL